MNGQTWANGDYTSHSVLRLCWQQPRGLCARDLRRHHRPGEDHPWVRATRYLTNEALAGPDMEPGIKAHSSEKPQLNISVSGLRRRRVPASVFLLVSGGDGCACTGAGCLQVTPTNPDARAWRCREQLGPCQPSTTWVP